MNQIDIEKAGFNGANIVQIAAKYVRSAFDRSLCIGNYKSPINSEKYETI